MMPICYYCGSECREIFGTKGLCEDPSCIEEYNGDLNNYTEDCEEDYYNQDSLHNTGTDSLTDIYGEEEEEDGEYPYENPLDI